MHRLAAMHVQLPIVGFPVTFAPSVWTKPSEGGIRHRLSFRLFFGSRDYRYGLHLLWVRNGLEPFDWTDCLSVADAHIGSSSNPTVWSEAPLQLRH